MAGFDVCHQIVLGVDQNFAGPENPSKLRRLFDFLLTGVSVCDLTLEHVNVLLYV
jgi:hypothetical protein